MLSRACFLQQRRVIRKKRASRDEGLGMKRGMGVGWVGLSGTFRLSKAHNETKHAHQERIYLKKTNKKTLKTKKGERQNVYGRSTDGVFPVGSGA